MSAADLLPHVVAVVDVATVWLLLSSMWLTSSCLLAVVEPAPALVAAPQVLLLLLVIELLLCA